MSVSTAELPFITVVVPVRNESRFIRETLGQLLRQDYPHDRCEIIVADGMSDDATPAIVGAIAAADPRVRLVENPGRRSSAGRNAGFRAGRGDLFLVVDGHCHIPDDRLFGAVADAFRESGAACLGRPQPLDPPGLTRFQRAVAVARGSRLGHGGDSLIYSGYEGFASPVSNGAAYRRDVFDKVGFVDESFDACEDVEFNYRVEQAGFRAWTSPRLTVRYYPREDLRGLWRQMFRYGQGRYRFIRKHRAAATLNQLVPACFVAGLAVLAGVAAVAAAAPSAPALAVTGALALPYLLYLVLVLAESVRLAAGQGWELLRWLPLVFPVVHVGLGTGFLVEAVSAVRTAGHPLPARPGPALGEGNSSSLTQ